MMNGSDISLRALEPEDIDVLYLWENDPSVWGVSGTLAPFSRQVLRQFIEKQQLDIWSAGQLRFVIVCNNDGRAVGTIDLFDADPFNMRAGVGILINGLERGRGYASQALELLIDYARNILLLNQLYCDIDISNEASRALFAGCGFSIRLPHQDARDSYDCRYLSDRQVSPGGMVYPAAYISSRPSQSLQRAYPRKSGSPRPPQIQTFRCSQSLPPPSRQTTIKTPTACPAANASVRPAAWKIC